MYNRQIQSIVEQLVLTFPVLSITGPRQSGKTTLCKMVFPQYQYINLEQESVRLAIQMNPVEYLRQFTTGVILDEAHYLPEVFSAIQVLVDEDKSRRFILSGSSNFLLMQNISQSLAGRVAILRLLPFSLSELGESAAPLSTDTLLLRGCFPAIWGDNRPVWNVYDSYFSTYIQRDVRLVTNIRDINLFTKFIRLCAARIGTEFNSSALANEVGVSVKTIQGWLSVLQTSYVAFTLRPYYRNLGKRLIKAPKVYFYDTGLVCYLLGLHSEKDVASCPIRGSLFENMVVANQLKERYHHGLDDNLYFYRDKAHEVDLLQEDAMRLHATEIKSATVLHPDFFKNLDYLREVMKDDILSTQVVYDGYVELPVDNNGYINYRHFPS
ncbi:MAG: ATP-binding protein [Paludibacteraceae bacterium]|nr:ATP-binding protein [Paludibacteraceae bacterium]